MRKATVNAAPPRVSQYGQVSDAAGASRARSGSKVRRLRSGPMAMPNGTRIAAIDTRSTASPRANPNRDREPADSATAPAALSAITSPESSSAVVVTRMRRHPSPISARSSVRIAAAMADTASVAAARAGAAASTHATPTTAKLVLDASYAWTTSATPTAATPEPASTITRRGSFPNRAKSGATIAATPLAYTRSRNVATFGAAMIGMSRYRITIATTDHTDCANALATGGAVVAVRVSQRLKGQSASRPATPTNSRIAAATMDLTPTPRVEWRTGTRLEMLFTP